VAFTIAFTSQLLLLCLRDVAATERGGASSSDLTVGVAMQYVMSEFENPDFCKAMDDLKQAIQSPMSQISKHERQVIKYQLLRARCCDITFTILRAPTIVRGVYSSEAVGMAKALVTTCKTSELPHPVFKFYWQRHFRELVLAGLVLPRKEFSERKFLFKMYLTL
jgi:hypothetical protein